MQKVFLLENVKIKLQKQSNSHTLVLYQRTIRGDLENFTAEHCFKLKSVNFKEMKPDIKYKLKIHNILRIDENTLGILPSLVIIFQNL